MSASNAGESISGAFESSPVWGQELLLRGCQQLGFVITDTQIAQFETYYRELVSWNAKFNLTAITSYEGVQVKHFLDCLAGWPIIAHELGHGKEGNHGFHLADIGTGAGFPGIPLKLVVPRLKLTLIDGTGKKIAFLRHVVQKLQLGQTQIVQGRAEELGRQPAFRGQFDVVTARAVAPLNTLVEYLLPFARLEGMAAIYKGAQAAEEFMAARKAIEVLGGEVVRFAPVTVPMLEEKRYVLLIRKTRPTPHLYPRGQGLPRKKPLG